MLQDIRHSLRAIARSKGTAAVLLLSLALGTGVNAAVYSALDALLLREPAGVEDASHLVGIYTSEFSGATYGPSSYPDFVSIRSAARSFATVAALDDMSVENVRLGDVSLSVRIASVSDELFAALHMRANAGRVLGPGDATQHPSAALVSYPLSELLGGAATVLGKTLTIGDQAYFIAGVTPPRFRGLQVGRECDVWIEMTAPTPLRGDRRLSIVARLAPGATLAQAQQDLRRLSDDLANRFPQTNRGSIVEPNAPRRITPVHYSQLDPAASDQVLLIAVVVGGATALLLAGACLNAGSLLLSRAVARRHEIAVKMALGASRTGLVRQLLVETFCLSLAGGGLGLLFAIWTTRAMPALFMTEQAELLDTRLDAHLILLTVGVACLAGALFGVAPALLGTASSAVTALRADPGGVSVQLGARLRALLAGGQIALSTLLLLATGILVASLTHALQGDLEFTAKSVAFVSLELPGQFGDPVRGIGCRNTLLARVSTVNGVETVGWASTLPLLSGNKHLFRIEGQTADVRDTVEFDTNVVSSGYFRTLSLPCIEGRVFDERDHALAPPVLVIDELLARRYFGPTATHHYLIDVQGTRLEIVGVVRSGRYRTLQQAPQPTVYYPAAQEYLWRGHLVARTGRDPATLLGAIDQAVRGGNCANVLESSTLETHLADSLALDRLTTTLVGLCGVIALAMATIGVYGVMMDAVQRRTREIGLRVALGARRAQVALLVLMEATYLAATGLLIGAGAAVAVSRLARSRLQGVPSVDVVMLTVTSSALAVVVVLAAIVPLRRALRVNPTIALRAE